MLDKYIDLSHQTPVAQGQTQFVYAHPQDGDVLIKTMQPRPPKKRLLFRYTAWRYGKLRLWHREYEEYIGLLARFGDHFDRLPRYYGFCETSEGPGFVTECLKGADGDIAPTLRTVLQDSTVDPAHLVRLRADAEALIDALRDKQVVFRDLTSKNLVVTGPDQDKLKLIDGLGTYAILPIRQISKLMNDKSVTKWGNSLMADIDGFIAARG